MHPARGPLPIPILHVRLTLCIHIHASNAPLPWLLGAMTQEMAPQNRQRHYLTHKCQGSVT